MELCKMAQGRYLVGYKAFGLMMVIGICIWSLDYTKVDIDPKTKFVTKDPNYPFRDVLRWPSQDTIYCGGNFTGYGRKFFRMKMAIYEPSNDSFKLMCINETLPPPYRFQGNDYGIGKYLLRIGHLTRTPPSDMPLRKEVSVIVDRCNSHNYYHAMQDWYNLYLISKFFNIDYRKMQLFVIDKAPVFHIDAHWEIMFPNLTRATQLKSPVLIQDAIFNIAGPESALGYVEKAELPYIEEFSRDILRVFDLVSNKSLDCSNLTITLAIRRDYYFHPKSDFLQKRNTQRKFKNEQELVQALRRAFEGHNVRTLVAEDMSLKDQLKLIVDTDILMGMHGCALTNTLFMPRHGGIFEMYPKFWEIKFFFNAIARWRGMHYKFWQNQKKKNEFADHYTYVPPDILINFANSIKYQIGCGV